MPVRAGVSAAAGRSEGVLGCRIHGAGARDGGLGLTKRPVRRSGLACGEGLKFLSVFGLGIWPAGPVDLFLKAGAARIDASGNVGAVNFSDKKIEFAYGAGVQLNLQRFGLRAEYEKFNTSVIGDLDVISVGVNYTFGAQ